MIVFAWLTIGNLGLWIMAFRHWKYSKYIHMTALTIITILNLMTGFLALLIWGIPNKMGNLHTGIGLTTIILFTLECVCGVVTLIVQKRSDFNAHKVIIWNNIHTILGKLLYLLMMVPILVPSRYTKP